ncbi:MAG: hypothetical protein KGM42_13420 [Hyphomicrobiales bacterium]|nr:hypothetical protein [Hyphomicrobiales bacterium]
MRRLAFAFLLSCALAGCESTQQSSPVAIAASFDPAEAAFIKKKGTTTIDGHAFWRDDHGATMNAAGELIRLVPVTAYSRERIDVLYKGHRSIAAKDIVQAPADGRFGDYTRTTRAESNGRFEFDDVAAGKYFVVGEMRYKERERSGRRSGVLGKLLKINEESGGAMYETVTVTGKEDKAIKLVLTNDR